MATQRVGGEVDSFCTRCKFSLAHTILAMVGTKLARVRCNTCGGDHVYRSGPPGSPSPRSSSSSGGGGAKAGRVTKEEKQIISFQERLAGHDLNAVEAYSPRVTYVVDQLVKHPTFGIGIVSAVRGDKVDVAFKADMKTLVHGRAPPPASEAEA